MEDGRWFDTGRGTSQASAISSGAGYLELPPCAGRVGPERMEAERGKSRDDHRALRRWLRARLPRPQRCGTLPAERDGEARRAWIGPARRQDTPARVWTARGSEPEAWRAGQAGGLRFPRAYARLPTDTTREILTEPQADGEADEPDAASDKKAIEAAHVVGRACDRALGSGRC